MWKLTIIGIVFALGVYFIVCTPKKEGFNGSIPYRCPNLLIQKGKEFYLYNSKLASVPGVNPVKFNTLEDYVEFVDWQRSQGIRCPVLYLQESYDAQGNPVYKARPSPTNLQGGLQDYQVGDVSPVTKLFDAGRDDPLYNKNSYPAFYPQDQYIGEKTPLYRMFHDTNSNISPNPMDVNWGGHAYTQKLIDQGKYDDDKIV